jgi:hypothetical protein
VLKQITPQASTLGRWEGPVQAEQPRVEDGFAVVARCAALPGVLLTDDRRAVALAIKEAAAAAGRAGETTMKFRSSTGWPRPGRLRP